MEGKVWKFGDDVDTDLILPGRYLIYADPKVLSKHCMEGLDTEFYKKVNKGDIIVGGKNFGCGSSREHAPMAIQATGIEAIIAESFARIFYRNGTNIGMPLLEAPGISKFLNQGDEIEIYMDEGLFSSFKNRHKCFIHYNS
ncbi:MAG: 3-isopropylmalate dehydratase [Methanobrevibacter sp.]|nr:3-isopropylmalate dehydratase [Candidatus Methanovirga australis]